MGQRGGVEPVHEYQQGAAQVCCPGEQGDRRYAGGVRASRFEGKAHQRPEWGVAPVLLLGGGEPVPGHPCKGLFAGLDQPGRAGVVVRQLQVRQASYRNDSRAHGLAPKVAAAWRPDCASIPA